MMMAKVTVEVTPEDLWSWWMLIMMAGKLFIITEEDNKYTISIFYKVHSDCCGKFWPQETDRVWPEARGLHQADL